MDVGDSSESATRRAFLVDAGNCKEEEVLDGRESEPLSMSYSGHIQ